MQKVSLFTVGQSSKARLMTAPRRRSSSLILQQSSHKHPIKSSDHASKTTLTLFHYVSSMVIAPSAFHKVYDD